MPTSPVNNFYPSISDLVSLDQIPVDLGNFDANVLGFLDNIFYKDLQSHKSLQGDSAFYSLKLVTFNPVSIEIPGTNGLALILNPSSTGLTTELPVQFHYTWEVLKYVKEFNSGSFATDPSAYYGLFLDILNITSDEFLSEVMSTLSNSTTPLQTFVADFNAKYTATTISITDYSDDDVVISNILEQISNYSLDFYDIIFNDYISVGSLDQIFENIKKLFKKWFGDFDLADLAKRLLFPQFGFSLSDLSIGLQIPANILRQVDTNNQPLLDG
ncbi:MAG: hypothetical protein ACXVHS_03175, partial [Methanobacterium sp.]